MPVAHLDLQQSFVPTPRIPDGIAQVSGHRGVGVKFEQGGSGHASVNQLAGPFGVSAWQGIDWHVINFLFEKGWISDPVGKQESVAISEEAVKCPG